MNAGYIYVLIFLAIIIIIVIARMIIADIFMDRRYENGLGKYLIRDARDLGGMQSIIEYPHYKHKHYQAYQLRDLSVVCIITHYKIFDSYEDSPFKDEIKQFHSVEQYKLFLQPVFTTIELIKDK